MVFRFLPILVITVALSSCVQRDGDDSHPGFPDASSPVTRKELYRRYPPVRPPTISPHFSLTAAGWEGIETYEIAPSRWLFAIVTYPVPKSKMPSFESPLVTSLPQPRQSPADLFSGVTIRIQKGSAGRGAASDGNARRSPGPKTQ